MKASVLGIGTELTDGQIVNKNASWISAQLKNKGLMTSLHLVVPDEHRLITEALDFCAAKSDVIFVTGGLGPTSDDFTRDVITAWAGLPLEFHEPSWQHLSERLISRGYVVQEMQRQQCYFPQGSEVLPNPQGTANGFSLQAHGKKLFILPGPPREIEAVWEKSIDAWATEQATHVDAHITRKWDTLGRGESDIAAMVEKVLENISAEKGYRVHLPYVEVKLSFSKSEETKFNPYVEKISQALAEWIITRDGEDVSQSLATKLTKISSFTIIDEVSGSYLLNRMLPALRDLLPTKKWNFVNDSSNAAKAEMLLSLKPVDEFSCEVGIEFKGHHSKEIVIAPYKTANMHDRRLQYFAERALIFWARQL